jgi:hypothetical protein
MLKATTAATAAGVVWPFVDRWVAHQLIADQLIAALVHATYPFAYAAVGTTG